MNLLNKLFDKRSPVPLDERQINLVRQSYEQISLHSDRVGELFYKNLFDLDPSLKNLFSGDMSQQQRKLMHMLDTAVKGLEDLDELLPSVSQLGKRHNGYGVKPEHFSMVGAALLNSIETELDEQWTVDLAESWTSFYTLLAVTMQAEMAKAA